MGIRLVDTPNFECTDFLAVEVTVQVVEVEEVYDSKVVAARNSFEAVVVGE